MKANELRIGNWLNGSYNGFSKDVQIYDFDRKQIQHSDEKQLTIDIKYFKPIPLTEEWLLKFGFKKFGHIFEIRFGEGIHEKFQVASYNDKKGFFLHAYSLVIKVEFVHDLQNLYFPLTRKELTIKE